MIKGGKIEVMGLMAPPVKYRKAMVQTRHMLILIREMITAGRLRRKNQSRRAIRIYVKGMNRAMSLFI